MRKEKKYTIIYLSVCITFFIISIIVSFTKNNQNANELQGNMISNSQENIEIKENLNTNESTEVSNFDEESENKDEIIETESSDNTGIVNNETKKENDENEYFEIKFSNTSESESKEKASSDEEYFEIKTEDNYETQVKESNNSKKQEKKSENSPAKLLKEKLKDDKWVKENIMMKTSAFDTPLEHEQKLTFTVLKGREDVIVQATSEEDLSMQIFLVSYKDFNINVIPLTEYPTHYYHVGYNVDANNFIIDLAYMHMGNSEINNYKIQKNGFEVIKKIYAFAGDYNEETEDFEQQYMIDDIIVTEDEYKDAIDKQSEYNFYTIETELTDENVDKYIF